MAKKMYIGVNNVARKVKKQYIGVDGKARKVKKGYIGVGGVARPFIGGGELAYYGTVTNIAAARDRMATANVGGCAVFAGGGAYTNPSGYEYSPYETAPGYTERYSQTLVRTLMTGVGSAAFLGGTSLPDYAIFGGGTSRPAVTGSSSYDYVLSSVYAYNSSFVRTSATALSEAKKELMAASVGGYAIFAGGCVGGTQDSSYVDVYDNALTKVKSYQPSTSNAKGPMDVAISTGKHAIFVGDGMKTAAVFNESLVESSIQIGDSGYGATSGTCLDGYTLIHVNYIKTSSSGISSHVNKMYGYNENLVRSLVNSSGYINYTEEVAAVTLGDFAIFAGGKADIYQGSSVTNFYWRNHVIVYDKALVKSTFPTSLSQSVANLTAATVGEFALFAGGNIKLNTDVTCDKCSSTNKVEAFTLV